MGSPQNSLGIPRHAYTILCWRPSSMWLSGTFTFMLLHHNYPAKRVRVFFHHAEILVPSFLLTEQQTLSHFLVTEQCWHQICGVFTSGTFSCNLLDSITAWMQYCAGLGAVTVQNMSFQPIDPCDWCHNAWDNRKGNTHGVVNPCALATT